MTDIKIKVSFDMGSKTGVGNLSSVIDMTADDVSGYDLTKMLDSVSANLKQIAYEHRKNQKEEG